MFVDRNSRTEVEGNTSLNYCTETIKEVNGASQLMTFPDVKQHPVPNQVFTTPSVKFAVTVKLFIYLLFEHGNNLLFLNGLKQKYVNLTVFYIYYYVQVLIQLSLVKKH